MLTACAVKYFAERKCYLIDRTQRTVALNYTLNKHMEYVQQIIIYR